MEEKKGKTNKVLIGIIIFLVLIIGLGAGYFICYMSDNNSNNNQSNTEINNNVEEDKQNNFKLEKVDVETVRYLYDKIQPDGYEYNSDDLIYYDGNKLLASSLSSKVKNGLAKHNLTYSFNDVNPKFSLEDFKKAYFKMFESSTKFEMVDSNNCPGVIFNNDNTVTIFNQCGGTGMNNLINDLVYASKDDNNLYIYEKYAFISYLGEADSDGIDLGYLYEDKNKTKKIDDNPVSYPGWNENNINKTILDKYNTLINKYTFKIENDNYYFISVEPVDKLPE